MNKVGLRRDGRWSDDHAGSTMGMLTTAEVAAEMRMSEDWVREHADELGGIRAGRTSRAPLRFEPEGIEAWKRVHRLARPTVQTQRRRRRGRAPADVELLPLPAPIRSARG